MNNKYYGFEYKSGKTTTTGTPNKITGRMSIAGSVAVFNTRSERDEWVSENSRRVSCNKRSLRSLCLGMSVVNYNEYLNSIEVLA